MLNRIFPKQFDNLYRGHWLAIWLLVVVMSMKAIQGVTSMIDARNVLTTADGLPLDRYTGGSAEVVIALFAVTSLYLLVLPLQSVVVLIRYRAMIPFMYLLFLLVQIGHKALLLLHPIARADAHPIGFYVNLAILAMTLAGFVLSLQDRSRSP